MPEAIIDMYKDFLAIVRKSRVGTVSPLEFSVILGLATEEVISNKIDNFELNKKFAIQLLPITLGPKLFTGILSETISGTRYKAYSFALPEDCRLVARLSAEISDLKEAKCNPLSSNELTTVLNGIFSKPTTSNCYYSLSQDIVETKPVKNVLVYVPNITIGDDYPKFRMSYVVNPPVITEMETTNTKESIFDREVCSEIITTASRMYLEGIQDSRYQTFNNELKFKH